MASTVLAARAVTSLYTRQLLRIALIIGLAIYAVVMGIVIWLSLAVSGWWLFLGVIPTVLAIIAGVIWLVLWGLSKRLAPSMDPEQTAATKKVVHSMNKAVEHVGTSRFILLFRLIKDAVFPSKSKQPFIGELAQTPGQLKRDFEDLRKLF